MFNTTHRLSWFSSLATVAILGLMTLLSGCGGGGATTPENTLPMTVVPGSALVYAYADTPTVLTIRSGKKPFNVYSDNPAIISFNNATMPAGLVPDEFITLGGPSGNYGRVNNVDVDTLVTLTVRDAAGVQVNVVVTVRPSSLNDTLSVTGSANGTACAGGAGVLCSGVQGTASVRATTITGGAVIGHKVRFRVMDQGAKYGFVCNQSLGDCLVIETDSLGHVINLETTTDRNGYAYAVIRADVNAPTQYATISATDQTTGHVLRKQFAIAGTALSSLGSGTWDITLPAVTVAGPPSYTYNTCPSTVVYSNYVIYGGTPPYTVTSTSPLVGTPMLPPPLASYPVAPSTSKITVNNAGDSFLMVWPCTPPTPGSGAAPAVAQGDVTIMITDATGLVLTPAPTFKVTVALGTGGTGGTATALYTTAPSALSIAVGSPQSFTIGGGTPPYVASSSDSSVATAGVSGSTLAITGVAAGTASIVVTDAAGKTVTIAVTVTGGTTTTSGPLAVSSSAVTLSPSTTTLYVPVSGGTTPYSVHSSAPGIATAELIGSAVKITRVATGAATITVIDSLGASKTIAVTSLSATPGALTVSSSAVTVSAGTSVVPVYVAGGQSPYTVSSNAMGIATVSIAGNTITITRVAAGAATITVIDSLGASTTIAVTSI